jgi:hypothetical protein
MRPLPRRILHVLALLFALGGPAIAADAEIKPPSGLNLHVFGFSYHPDRDGVRRSGHGNERNLGFGLNYALHEDEDGVRFAEAGLYRDSGRHTAKYVALGYQAKFGKRWRLGGALVALHSPTYNSGRLLVGPLPIATYDFGPVKLNAVYMPRIGGYNEFAVFGLYFSLPLGR